MTIDEAISMYCEADEALGFEERGYPACVAYLAGVVAISDEGDNGSLLSMYFASDFKKWIQAAKLGFDAGDFDSLCEAVNETRPTPKRQLGH